MQASLHRAVLIHLMLCLGIPFSLAERVKANFVILSVPGVISETTVALKLCLLHFFSPSELKNIVFTVVTDKNCGTIIERSLRTFHSLIMIFSLQDNQDKLDRLFNTASHALTAQCISTSRMTNMYP